MDFSYPNRLVPRRLRGLQTPRQVRTRSYERRSIEYRELTNPSFMHAFPRERDERTPERSSVPPLNLDDAMVVDDSAALDSGWTYRIVRLEAFVSALRSENNSIRAQLEELHQPPASSSEAARSSVGNRSEAARSSVGDRSPLCWTDRIVRLEETCEELLAEQMAIERRIESLTPIVNAVPPLPTPAPSAPRSGNPVMRREANESVSTLQEARTEMRGKTSAVLCRTDSAEERQQLERLFELEKPLTFKRALAVHLFGDKNVYLDKPSTNLQDSHYRPTAAERRMLLLAIALHAEKYELPLVADKVMWQQMSRAMFLNRQSRRS